MVKLSKKSMSQLTGGIKSMNKRECLYELPDLKLEGVLLRMNDTQLNEYWDTLHFFIDNYPKLEDSIKNRMSARNYKDLFTDISTLRDMLTDIHADGMAKEMQSQINANTKTENIRHERLEAFISYFLSTVTILSIDIQKAELLSLEETDEETDGKPEVRDAGASEESVKLDNQKTILAVDDNPVHLTALKTYLKGAPYKLTCLSSGEDALRYIEKKHPDLFILDIMMPGIDGIELAKRIKTSDPAAKIIFMTGSSSKDVVLKAFEAGCVDFIVKPANKDNVIARISKSI
jgi:CheY-like chemotaxis protein